MLDFYLYNVLHHVITYRYKLQTLLSSPIPLSFNQTKPAKVTGKNGHNIAMMLQKVTCKEK